MWPLDEANMNVLRKEAIKHWGGWPEQLNLFEVTEVSLSFESDQISSIHRVWLRTELSGRSSFEVCFRIDEMRHFTVKREYNGRFSFYGNIFHHVDFRTMDELTFAVFDPDCGILRNIVRRRS